MATPDKRAETIVEKYVSKCEADWRTSDDEGADLSEQSADSAEPGVVALGRRLGVVADADSSSGRSSGVEELTDYSDLDDASPFAWVSPSAARALRPPLPLLPAAAASGVGGMDDPLAAEERRRDWVEDPNGEAPLVASVCVLISCAIILLVAYVRDFLRRHHFETVKAAQERTQQKHFVPLYHGFEGLYRDSFFRSGRDCTERVVCSTPGAQIVVKDRCSDDYQWSFRFSGKYLDLLNLGSYNYLGFSEHEGVCSHRAAASIDSDGVAIGSSAHEYGSHKIHRRLEQTVADFVGVEDAAVFAMGFATNSMNLSCFASKGSLIISDCLNHASVVLGSRMSGAKIATFKHADLKDLEHKLRTAIIYGSSLSHRPFKNIVIIAEGIYSMEGTIVNLPRLIELKNKYGAYLFIDEAHSIGALGPHGRGICDYWGVDPNQVDINMGTFTKSFGSAGGYIAGSKKLIAMVKARSHTCYSPPMAPATAMQVIASMEVIMGRDGTREGVRRIETLARNTRYVRRRLAEMGLLVYGHAESPVIPFITFYISKAVCVSRELMARGLAIVAVAFPAVPITQSRIRLCMSAAHTKEQLDFALDRLSEVGDLTGTKYGKAVTFEKPIEY